MAVTLSGTATLARDRQEENALSPMTAVPSGMVTPVNEPQPKNALSPMISTPEPIVSSESAAHSLNAQSPMAVTLSGILTLKIELRSANVKLPTVVTPSPITTEAISSSYPSKPGSSHIGPVPSIRSTPSLSRVQVRASPQLPEATASAADTPAGRSPSRNASARKREAVFVKCLRIACPPISRPFF